MHNRRILLAMTVAAWLASCHDHTEPLAPAGDSPAPALALVSSVAHGETALNLPSDADPDAGSVQVVLPSGAVPAGTEVTLEALDPHALPAVAGGRVGPAFRLSPHGQQLAHPAEVTVQLPAHLRDPGLAPALLWWDPDAGAYEPQAIVDYLPEAGVAVYRLEHFSDYLLASLLVRVTKVELKSPLGTGPLTWEATVHIEQWPGFYYANLALTYDGQPANLTSGSTFIGKLALATGPDVTFGFQTAAPGDWALHELKIAAQITQAKETGPGSFETVPLTLWEQKVAQPRPVVADQPSDPKATRMLRRYAPTLVFQNTETSYPVSIESILERGGPVSVRLPTGQAQTAPPVPSGGSTAAVDAGLSLLAGTGHAKAFIQFNGFGGGLSTPDIPDPAKGTVYAAAVDLGSKRTALLYTMLFPTGRELGLGPPSPTGHKGAFWGGITGGVRSVVVVVKDNPDAEAASHTPWLIESVTYQGHLPGHEVEFLGDPYQPLFAKTSWADDRVRVDHMFLLSCLSFSDKELVPGEGDCPCKPEDEGGCAASAPCAKVGQRVSQEHPWVFVAGRSHALYPREGKYRVKPKDGGAWNEEAAGTSARVWQPGGFEGVCPLLDGYELKIIGSLAELTSAHELGYLLFSGFWGNGRYSVNRMLPFVEPWRDPGAWTLGASGAAFFDTPNHEHYGSDCYRCVANLEASSGGQAASPTCFGSQFGACQCSGCGPIQVPVNALWTDGKTDECNILEPCPPQPLDTPADQVTSWCSRTGLDYHWDVPQSVASCPGVLSQPGADCEGAPEQCGPCLLCNGYSAPSKPWSPWKGNIISTVNAAPMCSGFTADTCIAAVSVTGANATVEIEGKTVPACQRKAWTAAPAECHGYAGL